mgnify:CR=1 FL=1
MKLTALKIAGFKSFVDQTEFLIEPGLTGVVGPNGCGKSNLVEALRWVMGESSHKSLRASGMDDVIFAGTTGRPARNMAEVALVIDNSDRRAPSAFNDAELLEVTRRIEREDGSTYRLNGREVRARDVQLLFADAATGARSPAMVRQGQIGEIINAKPSARRRILEDAAGIAGLHGRRHEAELRLKAAEDNLQRLDDVMSQIEGQIDGLKRQSRQAERYKALAADIRRTEAVLALRALRDARVQMAEAEAKVEETRDELTKTGLLQAETAKDQAVAAAAMPRLREAEAEAAAALQRLVLARETLNADEARAKARTEELARRADEMLRDLEREKQRGADAIQAIETLENERLALESERGSTAEKQESANRLRLERETRLNESEEQLNTLQRAVAELQARRDSIAARLRTERDRVRRFTEERDRAVADLSALDAEAHSDLESLALASECNDAAAHLSAAEADAENRRNAQTAAREAESALRGPLSEADRQVQRLETEIRTLSKLLSSSDDGRWQAILDQITVRKGYESALGAAFGDDLDAALDPAAPVHWLNPGLSPEDPRLPEGATPLSTLVDAPAELQRRLAQIGLVSADQGEVLRSQLKTGQILVSAEGALWRWDGYIASAGAPTPAARRLAERNRLGDLEAEAEEARLALARLRQDMDEASAEVAVASAAEAASLVAVREARKNLETLRERLAIVEKRDRERMARRSALVEASDRLSASLLEAKSALEATELEERDLPNLGEKETALAETRAQTQILRAALADATAAFQSIQRETEARERRLAAIASEKAGWSERAEQTLSQTSEIEHRLAEVRAESEELAEAPAIFNERRLSLANEISAAETSRKECADELALAETALAEADRRAREALATFTAAREEKVRSDMRLEAAQQALATQTAALEERFEEPESALLERIGEEAIENIGNLADVTAKLDQWKGERERLGAVNLRADDELKEIEDRRTAMTAEKEDLVEAIRRLRAAIGTLNREGRERLLAAFEIVQGHFEKLFTSLFGGGTAKLQLIESDDPLEAGLEILAHPPGKKPSTLSLLSGGEQALTAIALIFAVFLTNPSPICVLDEVDAPLDDANVERYCDLLNDMAQSTETRFIVITHNPITMARMDRLFGVTMAERGVSQLVSVDLGTAESYLKAS